MTTTKITNLKKILSSYESAIVAYSGGVDSTLLCYLAKETLGSKFIAITATSEVYPAEEQKEAITIAKDYNWPHKVIPTKEMEDNNFISNTPQKCGYCKEIRFKELLQFARNNGYKHVLSGDNIDDLNDYRPGYQKAKDLGIKSPYIEAGITKSEIRAIAKDLNLPNYNKPASPCLATRIPYGIKITTEALKMVAEAEAFIRYLGYNIVRVRHYDTMAKIEIEKGKIINFVSFHADLVSSRLKEIGYQYTALDLEGYRMGSLNEVLENKNE